METVHALMAVSALAAVGILSPGPDFVVVSYTAMSGARRRAGWVASGVVVGNAMWATAAILGISALVALAPTFFVVFKIAGAAYLVWLGVKLVRGARIPLASEVTPGKGSGPFASWARGFVTTLANPKAAVFYASVLTAALPSSPASGLVIGTVAAVVLVATTWFTVVVLVLSTARASALFRGHKVRVEGVFGSTLAAFGLIRCLGAARELPAAWA